jgi:hypothetical protein
VLLEKDGEDEQTERVRDTKSVTKSHGGEEYTKNTIKREG